MAPADTNVLFVPYRPSSSTSTKSSSSSSSSTSNAPVISQQKHAAREYHRKARLQRLANLDAPHKRHGRSKSEQLAESLQTRPVLPRSQSFSNVEDFDQKLSVFDVGIGEFDPFNACVPHGASNYVLEMLEHGLAILQSSIALCLHHYATQTTAIPPLTSPKAASHQWRVFSSSSTSLAVGNIKNAILTCAMHSPAAFYTIIFAGATHNAFSRAGVSIPNENKMLRLSYKTQAIKELNREVQNLQGNAPDELLLCIITLAAHGSGEQLNPPTKEENTSPLATAQNFQYYGMMRWETAHLNAIRVLIKQKGGLHTVKMPGLANAIGLADIFIAFQNLNKPSFPLLAPTSLVMSTWPEPPSPLPPALRTLTMGLQKLRTALTCEPLYEIISTLRQITIGFSMYLSGHPDGPSLVRILWARNSVQHDLLSLDATLADTTIKPEPGSPTMQHSSIFPIFSPPQSLYTLLRQSTLAYTLLVLFPLPRVAGLHTKISQRLMLALDDCMVLDLWRTQPEVLLWSTVLGGIVAGSGSGSGSGGDTEADEDYDTSSASPSSSGSSSTPSPSPSLRPWFLEMTTHARSHIPSLSTTFFPPPSKRDTKPRPSRDFEASWPVVRDICASFLWFDGPEFERAARTFWNESCGMFSTARRKP